MNTRVRNLTLALLAVAAALGAADARALTFNFTYDPSVAADFGASTSSLTNAMTYVAQTYESLYSNPITLNITVTATAGTAGLAGSNPITLQGPNSYATVRNALIADANNNPFDATKQTSVANLPAFDPSGGNNYWMPPAEAKALGLPGNGSTSDGTIHFTQYPEGVGNIGYTFDPNNRAVPNEYDFIGAAEHEVSEIMGRAPGLGGNIVGSPGYYPYDLFRYYGNTTVRDMANGSNVWFSYDGGNTDLLQYNFPNGTTNTGDATDWVGVTHDAFNQSTGPGVENDLSAVDKQVLDVLGYDRVLPGSTWSTTAPGTNWVTPANWVGGVPSSTETARFNGASYTNQPNLVGQVTVDGIWDTGSGAVTISGSALTLLGANTVNGNANVGIELDAGAGPLTITAPVFLQNSVQYWINNSANPITVSGGIQGGGQLIKTGSGVLTLSGFNELNGPLTIDGGTLNMPSGSLTTTIGHEYVGASGIGTFTQSGGVNFSDNLSLGFFPGSSGTYNLNGGLLNLTSLTKGGGAAAFNFSGGTFQIPASMSTSMPIVFNSTGGNGVFDSENWILTLNRALSGPGGLQKIGIGTLIVTAVNSYSGDTIVSNGILQITSGKLPAANETVGGSGGASFVLAGGSNVVASDLILADNPGDTGTYTMSDPSHLSAVSESLGYAGTGSFIQSGGTNSLSGGTLTVGVFGTGSYNLQSNGLLSAPTEILGWTSTGSFTQSGGTNLVAGVLYLGDGAFGFTGSGSYNLSGNGLLASDTEYIGYEGPGSFMQTGGSHSVSSTLYIGTNPGSNGTYTLGSGSLSALIEYIGYNGSGSFTQTGGNHAVTGNLYLGYSTGSSATYALGGGSLSALIEYVGYSGSGSFTQTGGTHSVPSALWLGYNANSSGTYTLGGSGAPVLTVANELIGNSGSGAVTQTGGIHTVTADFALGVNASGVGTYNLSGSGQLSSSSDEQIGVNGTGNFTHSGGTNAASADLYLGQFSGGGGNYYLSGSGQLSVANTEHIGFRGTGVFTQVGGMNSVGTLELAYSNGSTGSYSLNGGLLHLSSLTQGSGAATFDFTGGTFQAATGLATSVPMNFAQQGNTATFDTNGSTLTLNGALSGPGGMQKGGAGALILAVSNGYTGPTMLNAGMLVVSNNASATGTVTLNGGTLAAAAAGGTIGGLVQFGNGPHTIAPGAVVSPGNYGTLNLLGGLTTDLYTRLVFNLNLGMSTGLTGSNGDAIYGGDLINLGTSALNVNGGIISFVNTPTNVGDYRLFHNVGNSPSLGFFVPPSHSGLTYSFSSSVDFGYIDMVVANSVVSSGGTWNVNNNGSWAVGGNWTNSTVPNSGTVAFAGVPGGPSFPLTVVLNGNQSAGALVFSVSNGNGYILSQGSAGALTLGTSSGAAISVLAGAHIISAPLAMAGNMTVSTAGGTSLQLVGPLYEQTPGTSLTLSGGGLVIFSGTGSYTGNTNVNGGTLQINGGQLPAANEHVDASLVQAGGVNAVSGDIFFGTNSSGSGTLSGGNLQCGGNERIGYFVVSSFVQTGGNNVVAATLYVGDAAESQSSYTLSGGGQLTAGNETVGYVSNGAFTQNGGNNTVSSDLTLASNNGVFADYFLNSGNLSAITETVGASGGGGLTQAGGNNTVVSTLYVGYYGNGSYGLSGSGQLSAPAEYIGFYGTGAVTQTGGTNSVSSGQTTPALYLGYNAGSNGTYSLSDSGLLSAPNEYVGYTGNGTFNQSGGTNSAPAGFLNLGYNAGSSGTYNLNGGLLSVGVGNAEEVIGSSGSGSFTQTGGSHVVSGILILGENAGGSGSYSQQGGNLAANAEWVGLSGSGSFSQSGGTNTAFILFLGLNGGSGTYNLSGNGQLSAAYEYIGYQADVGSTSGTGSFTQTGGTNSAGSLNLAYSDGYAGTYTLNGGLLSLTSLNQGSGTATFNFGGGTFQAAAPFTNYLPIVLTTAGSNGVFDTNGNLLTLAGSLSGPGGLQKIGAGELVLSGSNTYGGGTFVMDGTLILTNSEAIADGTSLTVGDSSMFQAPVVPSRAESSGMAPVPEPGTLALFSAAVCGAAAYRRLRSRWKNQ